MRIAILTHATAPRGEVAHALSLGEALCALGHEAVVHAPDPIGRGFYRDATCPLVSVAAKPVVGSVAALFGARIADYLAHFATPAACDFDVFHAQCSISGNALATLTRRRLIQGFVRTVHRVETFDDPALARWQDRAIGDAGRLLCVSAFGAASLAADYGVDVEVVGNGVDGAVYKPEPDSGDALLRHRLGLRAGPIFLSIGGFEMRRNALAIIEAFATLRREIPEAQLILAGGDAALDRTGYAARCWATLEREGLEVGPGRPVILTGLVAQADMPRLYRLADTLVFPSLAESFGVCVLEALACGTPPIVPARPPFSEYLTPGSALWIAPDEPGAIASAMRASLDPARRARMRNVGRDLVRDNAWAACAARHLPSYAALVPTPVAAASFATGSAAWNIKRMPTDG
ncbi:MSMEG_0565 family glycosyltransferase [Methylobacterium mesophilicum SR1.6/6]|uniref:MSMEG_0565 family glycosyltransferase n=1 Tax=Methylobacterium mesophilicum SR1.6/6 TaxID=908290 RepID=A0A6B9FQ31_9HYPH|nr:MSMEG_0565 family glycosyltransferase [Methylobacterium mesophilicum]QGY03128.1 MSMEG_0565 family glycosyltransferase [Methylobacterium mesophilicum SR1.6/6]